MVKRHRNFAILLFLTLIIMGCSIYGCLSRSTAVATPTPTPTPIVFPSPIIPTPTAIATPSCFLFWCTTPTPSCQPQIVYDDVIDQGQSWKVVEQKQDQNNTSSSAQVTLTSTTSTTVTVTDQNGVTTSVGGSLKLPIIGAITASVQTYINHKVSQSVTTTISNSTTITLPPGQTVFGNYGVKVQETIGRLYDQAGCEGNNSNWGTDITYVPIADGWCTWISGQTACPSV